MKDIVIHSSVSKYLKPDKFLISCKFWQEDKDQDKAKSNLVKIIDERILKFINTLNFDKDSFVGEYSNSGRYSNDRQSSLSLYSYISSFNLIFESMSLDKLKELYDLICSESKSEVTKIVFGFSKIEDLEKDLMKEALVKAIGQKDLECYVIGENPENLKIVSWKNEFKKEASELALIDNKLPGFSNSPGFTLNFDPKPMRLTLNLSVTYSK